MTTISSIIQYNSQTVGREKICRLLQYTCKLLSDVVKDQDALRRLKLFEMTLSTSRKTFRVGKSVDMLQGALNSRHVRDPVVRYALYLSRLSSAVYFFYDMLAWAIKAGIMRGDARRYALRSFKFWSLSLFASLVRDLYELRRYYSMAYKCESESFLSDLLKYNASLIVDSARNVCDFVVALEAWGKLNVSAGTVGACGMVSSALGILEIIRPRYKFVS